MNIALQESMDPQQHCTKDYTQFGKLLTEVKQDSEMMSSLPTKLWYQTLAVIQEDAPEIVDEFLENSAAKMEVTVDYLMDEFL